MFKESLRTKQQQQQNKHHQKIMQIHTPERMDSCQRVYVACFTLTVVNTNYSY